MYCVMLRTYFSLFFIFFYLLLLLVLLNDLLSKNKESLSKNDSDVRRWKQMIIIVERLNNMVRS